MLELSDLILSLESHLGVGQNTPVPLPSHPAPSSATINDNNKNTTTATTPTTVGLDNTDSNKPSSTKPSTNPAPSGTQNQPQPSGQQQQPSGGKKQTAAGKGTPKAPTPYDQYYKAHLQIGKLVEVKKHPTADKLFLCQVQVSSSETRQFINGISRTIHRGSTIKSNGCRHYKSTSKETCWIRI